MSQVLPLSSFFQFRAPIFGGLTIFAGLLSALDAQATLPRPGPGTQNVRLRLDNPTRKGLLSGAYKVGSSIPLSLAFNLPSDSSCTVRIVFRPMAGQVQVPNRTPLTAQGDAVTDSKEAAKIVADSGLGANGSVYQLSCNQFQIGSRVTFPFTFRSTANLETGSAIDASVEVFGGKGLARAIGYSTLVLASDANQVLRISSTEAINQAQLEGLLKDPKVQLRNLVATQTLPLDEKSIPAELSTDVSDLKKDPSQAQ